LETFTSKTATLVNFPSECGDAADSQPNRVPPLGAKTFLLAPLLLLTTGI
jgi:hypothetical protein